MTLNLPPELESALVAWAAIRDMSPDALSLEVLEQHLLPAPPTPRNDLERKLLSAAMPCGVVLTNEPHSLEVLYDS